MLASACSSSEPRSASGGTANGGAPGAAGATQAGAGGAELGVAGASGSAAIAGAASGGRSAGGSAGSESGGAASGSAGQAGASGGAAAVAGAGGSGGTANLAPGYFVSPTGSDDNAGTIDAPFATLEKARDVVRALGSGMSSDIHVYLRGGTYRVARTLTFGVADSGSNGHEIHYEAYPGETPVLNGATAVSGWTPFRDGIYRAALDRKTKLRNLYVNDARALMASKVVTARGGTGTYSVTAGQASWAWATGSASDGVKYDASALPAVSANKDDLEIVNGTTWNENIVCTRDVITTSDNYRGLLLQEPYGAIAQLPGWNAGFSSTGSHTVLNALELLTEPGRFYFDKTAGTLYYYPRAGEDITQADVEAPVLEELLDIAGDSNQKRVQNLTFQGLTFANTDYSLVNVADSHGKATVQGATAFIAFGDGNWHNGKYEITDTLPAMIHVTSADSIHFVRNVVKHSGSEGISFINDVINSEITGNYLTDIAGSGITVGHPQHVYVGDGGTHAKFAPGVEGICSKDAITNNVLVNVSSLPGFGGHAGITAFFVDTLAITHNLIQTTAYNGINLGWGWSNFPDSKTSKNNSVTQNRLFDTLSRLHDSGAIYTLGQMPDTHVDRNYVKGIPPATQGPTYGLHNDEGSAYITENDNVLDIDPGVKYTINCEDFGNKHDLTILRTYATVNKMGANPPSSTIDPPVVVADAVWAPAQYATCLASGVEDAFRDALPAGLVSDADYVFPASVAVTAATTPNLDLRALGDAAKTVWFAPAGSTHFAESASMTSAPGDATSIRVPATTGSYKLCVVDAGGTKLAESKALLRVK